MMVRFVIGLGVAAMLAAPAAAAPATPEQAAEIRSTLERYLGRGEGGTSPVSVTPKGDGYGIALDIGRALAWTGKFGSTFDAAPFALTATQGDGGTWHVVSADWPAITAHLGPQSYTLVVNGGSFDGVLDPALPGFTSSSLSYQSMSVGALGADGETQTRQIKQSKQTSTATASGAGITDVQAVQSNAGFDQQIVLAAPVAGSGAPSSSISIKSEGTTGRLSIDRLHARALLDLWAFLVAHTNEDALKASQAELRDRLRDALPLFDRFEQSGATEHLAVESPVGPFAARSIEGRLRVSGLVSQGQVGSEVRIMDLAIPGGLVPPWSESLLPTSAEISESLSGFHLDAPARILVDTLNLDTKSAIPPDTMQKLVAAFGSLDQMVLTVAPSHLVSKALDLRFDGTVQLKDFNPEARFNVRATGLDKAIAAIQAAGGQDPTARQVLAALVLAKGLGKAETDGALSWVVVTGTGGATTVNGLSLPGLGAN